ncbi:MAG: lipocalin family protein [Oceanihabitans sp.]
MKNLKFVLLTVVAVFLFNCNSSDDSDPTITPPPSIIDQIAHKWLLSSVIDPDNGVGLPLNECDKNGYYDFSTNGNVVFESFNTESDGSCSSSILKSGTFEIGDNNGVPAVGMSYNNGDVEGYNIFSISETELVLETSSGLHRTYVKE